MKKIVKKASVKDVVSGEKTTKNRHSAETPVSLEEKRFYADVLKILAEGRNKAHAAVNTAMVETYWNIGRRIVEQEQHGKKRANYGEYLLVNLSRHLSDTLGDGFSIANLKNIRKFYLTWPDNTIGYTVCSQLSWSHIRLIMRLDTEAARAYYLNESRAQGWSVRVLERNIRTNYYERLLSSQKKALSTAEQTNDVVAEDLIKDPYVLEFLNLPENPAPNEATIESAIISRLQAFLMEMGKGFSFVGRQFRISTETSHFYNEMSGICVRRMEVARIPSYTTRTIISATVDDTGVSLWGAD